MASDRMRLTSYTGFAVAAMLVLALASMPYGYYTLLRLSVFVVGSFIAFAMFEHGAIAWAVGFGLLALCSTR